jgi:hypothetical protein
MTQHFVSQVRKFPDFLTTSKRTVAAVPGKKPRNRISVLSKNCLLYVGQQVLVVLM